jgi:hypothetical protein
VIPEWAWAVAGGIFIVLLGLIKFLATREMKRNDDAIKLVADHVRKEEAVWLKIDQIFEQTREMDDRIGHLETLANGKVQALTDAVKVVTTTLANVLERRTEPRV